MTQVAMNILNNGRFGLAASMAGTQKFCLQKAVDFATQRKQFGKTIDNYGSIQEKLGRMATLQYVTESLAFMLAGNMDKGSTEYHLESAVAKVSFGYNNNLLSIYLSSLVSKTDLRHFFQNRDLR